MRPLFSILHPSARPEKWQAVYKAWLDACVDASQVEYLLGTDKRWGFDGTILDHDSNGGPRFRVIENTGRRCYVEAVNNLAKHAQGQILIVIADDQFPCENWDAKIYDALLPMNFGDVIPIGGKHPEYTEFVVRVSTGTPNEHERRIMVMPILSRARYQKLGYVFYPEYESMFADNDFCEMAERDGIVIEARHLVFPHKHVGFDWQTQQWIKDVRVNVDDAYAQQNRPEAYRIGREVIARRRAANFGSVQSPATPQASTKGAQGKEVIAFCYPGESFREEVHTAQMILFGYLLKRFDVQLVPGYTSNVYHTRMEITRMMMSEANKPDYVLWMDDDNIPTPEAFEQLYADLQQYPEVDVMAGWCWIHFTQKQQAFPSCGNMEGGKQLWFGHDWAEKRDVHFIGWTGFPFALMRFEALQKAGGAKAWLPIMDERYSIGMSGEDIAWCIRAGENGVKMAADPRVRVEHMKTVAIQPVLSTPKPVVPYREPRIAAVLRVKNEARWIDRVIGSLGELCNAGVFVMDDGSNDDTAEICWRHGAKVYQSPFITQPLDEGRDKNWLVAKVMTMEHPDFILCIDGDEQLEPGAAAKIREQLRAYPEIDVWAFKFWHLWNSEKTARVDRWYDTFYRYSLFRPGNHAFKSLYAESGAACHSGLHTGNVPAGQIQNGKAAVLDGVRLIHYGPMLAEDRIRKYRYYNSIDPNNEIEDHYRHVAQGDLPELPASARFKYAGPLKIAELPEEIQPAPFAWMSRTLTEFGDNVTPVNWYEETVATAQ